MDRRRTLAPGVALVAVRDRITWATCASSAGRTELGDGGCVPPQPNLLSQGEGIKLPAREGRGREIGGGESGGFRGISPEIVSNLPDGVGDHLFDSGMIERFVDEFGNSDETRFTVGFRGEASRHYQSEHFSAFLTLRELAQHGERVHIGQ